MPAKNVTHSQLDRIEGALIGNGREGLLARTARIEEQIKAARELAGDAKTAAVEAAEEARTTSKEAIDAIHKVAIDVTAIGVAVTAHHKQKHLADLLKEPKFYAILIVAYITLHSISTYAPSAWAWLMKLVGLPTL